MISLRLLSNLWIFGSICCAKRKDRKRKENTPRHLIYARKQLERCSANRESLLPCLCHSPSMMLDRCYSNTTDESSTPLGNPKTLLSSNYHCSICRTIIGWLSLRDTCAHKPGSCADELSAAKDGAADLEENFGDCWTQVELCEADGTVHRSRRRAAPIPIVTRQEQNRLSRCIRPWEMRTKCFTPSNIPKDSRHSGQHPDSWFTLLPRFAQSNNGIGRIQSDHEKHGSSVGTGFSGFDGLGGLGLFDDDFSEEFDETPFGGSRGLGRMFGGFDEVEAAYSNGGFDFGNDYNIEDAYSSFLSEQ